MFDFCFEDGTKAEWKQSRTNLMWGLCAQVKKKFPHNSKTTSQPQRPLGGDSMSEGQMWGLGLKAVHLPQSLWKKESEEAQLKWRETLAASVYVRSFLLFWIWKKEKEKERCQCCLPSPPPSGLRRKKNWWQKVKEINGTLKTGCGRKPVGR